MIDLDANTVTLLKAHRRQRGALVLAYARDDALVLGDYEGRTRHPERFSRVFAETVARCRHALGQDALPVIPLHGLRHTHATHLLAGGEDLKMVSERLGHASPVVTMTVYAHVLPGRQRQATERFAAAIEEGRS